MSADLRHCEGHAAASDAGALYVARGGTQHRAHQAPVLGHGGPDAWQPVRRHTRGRRLGIGSEFGCLLAGGECFGCTGYLHTSLVACVLELIYVVLSCFVLMIGSLLDTQFFTGKAKRTL